MRPLSQYKLSIIFGLLIIILYFGLRLPNLTLQPIFADEAIYIRWAQVMRAEPTLRFLPLTDGKTPLFMWTLMPVLKLVEDPLLAGRLLSVGTGFITLLGVFFLARKVFGTAVACWSALIYTITPYTVFFDRMALVDSMLAAFTIWSIYFAVWLLKSQRLDLAMILGFLMGAAWLTKTPAMVNLLALPTTILGFQFKGKKEPIIKLVGCWIIGIVIALGIYNLLRLGPGFSALSSRNGDYVFSLAELSGRPLDPFLPHWGDIKDFFPKLLTWPILIFGIVGIANVVWTRYRLGLVLLIWVLIPLLLFMAFLKTFTARYLLISIPPLLILAGYGISFVIARSAELVSPTRFARAKEKHRQLDLRATNLIATLISLMVILPLALHFNYFLLNDPSKANLPKNERRGYLEDWTAGYGFKELAQFFKEQAKVGPVVVGTEGSFGTLPDGLQIYLDKDQVTILGGGSTVFPQLKESAKTQRTFYVANKNRLRVNPPDEKLIMEIPKAIPLGNFPQDAIVVYEVGK